MRVLPHSRKKEPQGIQEEPIQGSASHFPWAEAERPRKSAGGTGWWGWGCRKCRRVSRALPAAAHHGSQRGGARGSREGKPILPQGSSGALYRQRLPLRWAPENCSQGPVPNSQDRATQSGFGGEVQRVENRGRVIVRIQGNIGAPDWLGWWSVGFLVSASRVQAPL